MSSINDKDHNFILKPCSEKEKEYIHNKLVEHNVKFITDYEEFSFCYKDEDEKVVGGIVASRDNECLTIDFLWVDNSHRGKGIGAKLIKHMESIVVDKKCKLIYLNTFGFQAPEFYKKMGYELFGLLEECINGYDQYFFKKEL